MKNILIEVCCRYCWLFTTFCRTHISLQSKRFVRASNFETLTGNLEVEKWNFELKFRNSKLKLQTNFQIFLETFILEFGLFFKLAYKANHRVCKKKFQGRSEKFYEVPDWSFEVSIPRFILNFEVSD